MEFYSDPDEPTEFEAELKRVKDSIAEYLETNSQFHLRSKSSHHSWPCGVWDQKPKQQVASKLRLHGMVPKNWLILKRIDYGKETLGDSEGDQ